MDTYNIGQTLLSTIIVACIVPALFLAYRLVQDVMNKVNTAEVESENEIKSENEVQALPLTYKQLAVYILTLPVSAQNSNVTVYCRYSDETLPVEGIHLTVVSDKQDGVLDNGHPVLTIDF